MPDRSGKPAQITLLLRLLCGGYLIYLAWGLFTDGEGLFLAAGAVFALAGAALLIFTLRTMLRPREEDPPELSDGTDDGKDETT